MELLDISAVYFQNRRNKYNAQGDLCNSDKCFLGISLKLVKVQSSIIVQKKRNSIAFYLVPEMRKSVKQFFHSTQKCKSGQNSERWKMVKLLTWKQIALSQNAELIITFYGIPMYKKTTENQQDTF